MRKQKRPAPDVERLGLRAIEVADALGVSRSQAYELIASGEIPSIRIGRTGRRVPPDSLKQWIARQLAESKRTAPYASVVALGGNRFDRRHALPADWQAIEADLGRMPPSPLDQSSSIVRLLLDEGKQSSVNLVCVVARRRRAC